jgi:hypothetical protein
VDRSIQQTGIRAQTSLLLALPLILAACSRHSPVGYDAPTTTASAAIQSSSPAPVPSAPVSGAATNEHDEADENGGGMPVTASPSTRSDSAMHGPRIKGIELGDSPEDVRKALGELLPAGSPCQISPDAEQVTCDGIPQQLQGRFTYESGRLVGYKFYSYLTSLTFGRMSFEDFTRNFMSAYGVPRMDPAQDDPMFSQYLRYRDDGGWEVGIYPDNAFYVKSALSASQQAKSFN